MPWTLTFEWTLAQLSCAIICACLPTLLPVVPKSLGHRIQTLTERIQLLVSKPSSWSIRRGSDENKIDLGTPAGRSMAPQPAPWELKKPGSASYVAAESFESTSQEDNGEVPQDGIAMKRVVDVSSST